MKTNKIKQWAALLLTVSGMAAIPLTVTATITEVTGTSITINGAAGVTGTAKSGVTYDNSGVTATRPVYVYSSGWLTGDHLTIIASATANPGYNGVTVTTGGTVSLADSAINTARMGITASGTSVVTLNNTNITTGVGPVAITGAYGIAIDTSSTLAMTGGTVSSINYGIYLNNASSGSLGNVTINTQGSSAHGICVTNTSSLTVDGGAITTAGVNSYGVFLTASSAAALRNLTIETTGSIGMGIQLSGNSAASLDNVSISTAGNFSFGFYMTGSGDARAVLNNVQITTTGTDMAGYGIRVAGAGDKSLEIRNSSVTAKGPNTAAIFFSPEVGITNQVVAVIDRSFIISECGYGLTFGNDTDRVKNWASIPDFANTFGTYDVTISNYSVIDSEEAHDAIHINSIFTGTLSGDPTVHTGTINLLVNLHIDNAEIAGDVNILTSATANIDFKNNAELYGNLEAGGLAEANVSFDNSDINGGIIGSGSSTINVTGSNGATVSGGVEGKDDATINVNISGPGSNWLGDVNQEDNSKIVINLDNGANGTGGFNGGDLIVGGGSEFTFDKDSHGNNGINNGTWNIGDKNVNFDNLENNGKIIINVDTDSGTPKGSLSTDNGSGNGTIVINPGGNGTGNPDDILNGVVNGPGTDGWQWEDIDWGLKQYEVTPNPDGSLTIRETGKSSTVSALTQGLLAAQKSSWFAQQNSLLKRMGDLRLNAERTTNISGKDDDKDVAAPLPTADALISNIWIRSYGAQYNYGAQVTGRGFKQYTYGVDIGTDHKWSLANNDEDLYTGVFAGYGRADTDHRYNGSESNLNNYYFGLYASWLNDSGWYLDATLKAQYSDHELSGYHGGIDYFSAKYHNWSIGGSIEIGKKFTFQDDWFIEPQLQANYLHILASDYNVSTDQQLTVSDLDAVQLRAGIVMGRTIKIRNWGIIQPYVKISGVEMLSSGGDIKSGNQSQRPNLDGARAELGGGIIWQVDANNQLHLDYEASFGDKYDKPWGLTAGYRYQF